MRKHLFLLLILVAALMGRAQSPVWIDGLYYTLDASNHTAALTMPNSWAGLQVQHLVIPDNVVYNNANYAVTSIGENVFYSWLNLTEVTIGANIESIDRTAFVGCTNIETVHFNALHCTDMQYPFQPSKNVLTTLTIGPGVTSIPDKAFKDHIALTGALVLPSTLTYLGQYAFYGTALTGALVLPSTLTYLGSSAFYGTAITSLNIDVAEINGSPFGGCNSLTEVTIGPNVQSVASNAFQNSVHIETVHFNAINCTSMTSTSFSPFIHSVDFTTLTIGAGVTSIPDHAFASCTALTGDLVIPTSVTYLGQRSFMGTAITSLNVDVTEIKASSFNGCNSLTEVTIGPNVQSVASNAFMNCAQIETVHFNAINCASMMNSSTQSVFYSSRSTLTTLSIGAGVTRVPNYAFVGMQALTGPLVLPVSLTTMGIRAFYGCSNLSGAVDLTHVTSLGASAFYNCSSITSVIVNTEVPTSTFGNCTSLDELTVGPGVTSLEINSFESCSNIATLHFNATHCNFMGYNQSSVLFQCRNALQTLTIGEGVTLIPDYAFRYFANITSPIVFPNSLQTIGKQAFEQCTGLTQVTFPTNMMAKIDDAAFSKCSGIQGSVSVNCYDIGDQAFLNCSAITNLDVNTYELGVQAFVGCSGIRVLTLGPDMFSMGDFAFNSCDHIETVNYNVRELRAHPEYPFYDCTNTLTCVNIGEGVTTIAADLFYINGHINDVSCACMTPPAVTTNIFLHPSLITLHVPYGAMNAYRNHAIWGQFNLAYIPYQLWVGNTQVTVENAADILGDGKVSYDIANNILVLNGADISISDAPYAIQNYIPGLTIRVDSQSVVATALGYGIISHEDFSIVANSLLTVQGILAGIQAEGNLTIRGSNRVEAIGVDGGVFGNIENTNSLIVNGATLYAKATGSAGRSLHFGSLTCLGGVVITTPTNGLWDTTQHCVTDSNGIPVSGSEVVIGVQTYSEVEVANIVVTSANADDITGPCITGHISYDADTHTLILDNATITYDIEGYSGIHANSSITIRLIGDNTIVVTGNYAYGIYAGNQESLTIEGTGTLDVKGCTGISAGGIILKGGCQVKAEGTASGYFYGAAAVELLSIDNSVLRAKCAAGGASSIRANDYTFTGCEIIEPQGVHWLNSMVTYTSNNSPVKEWVVIAPAINGNIEVAGTTVNWENAADVLGDGTVSYDIAANTLTLNNANIEREYPGIAIDHTGVKIVLVGDNTITSSYNYAGILSWKDLTIMGEGSLTVSGGSGINVDYGDFIIQGGSRVTAVATGMTYNAGITGSSSFSMIVDDAYVRATGSSDNSGVISGFGSLTLTDCELVSPAGAAWNAANHRLELNGAAVVDASIASTTYFLEVCGYAVTSANAADILGDGTASYDPITNTLTFDNVHEVGLSNFGVWNKIPNLRILLKGDNMLAGSLTSIRSEQADVIIEGPGRISLQANTAMEINGNLTICNNAVVEAVSKNNGKAVDGDYPYALTVDNATLIADGTLSNSYPIYSFKNLVMNGCSVIEPQGIVWHCPCFVDANGDPVRNARIVIGKEYDLYVAGIRVDDRNTADVLGDGHVSYDPGTNTLTFADALFSVDGGSTVDNSIPDLHVVLEGTNHLHNTQVSQYNLGFYTSTTMTIEGEGTLNLTGYSGITAEGDSLVIRGGCRVIVDITSLTGGRYRRCVYGDASTQLIIRNSRLEVHSPEGHAAISGFNNMLRSGCQIITPSGAIYDLNEHRLEVAQGPVYDAVIDMARYDLYVAGRQVTAANAGDVLGDGTVSYSYVTNRLTLNNAHITSETKCGISNTIQDLRVMLVGDNTITTYASGIHNEVSGFTIMGTGTLSINAHEAAIEVPTGTLALSGGCLVDAYSSGTHGIIGNPDGSCSINGSTLVADGIELPIFDFGVINMEGCEAYADVDIPIYGLEWEYDEVENGYAFHYGGGELVDYPVVFTSHYGISVYHEGQEIEVTHYNAADVLGDGGSVHYDASLKKLTLDNATLESIITNVANLDIELVGENAITQNSEGTGLDINQDTRIIGPGSLYLRKNICINVRTDAKLIIRDCIVDAVGCGSRSYHAIQGHGGDLSFYNVTLTVEHENTDASCTIYGFNDLFFNDVDFIEPYLGQWDATNGYVVSSGQYMGRVVIGPAYSLWVLDTHVTPSNAYDVMGNGTVSYDPSTATLTLHDAMLSSSNRHIRGINSNVENLVIDLQGDNTIYMSGPGVYLGRNSTIEGEGSLYVIGNPAVNTNGNLTIQGGCAVEAVGIHGNMLSDAFCGGSSTILTIGDATVRASNTGTSEQGTINGYADLNLTDGASVIVPEGAVWDANSHCLKVDGNKVIGSVIIAPAYDLSVAGIRVTSLNANDVLQDGGSVVFNPETLTLTLTDVNLSNNAEYGINNHINGLNIVVVGDNTISMADGIDINNGTNDLYITGDGTLTLGGGYGIVTSGNFLITDACTVTVNNGIQGLTDDGAPFLYVYEDALLIARGQVDDFAIKGFDWVYCFDGVRYEPSSLDIEWLGNEVAMQGYYDTSGSTPVPYYGDVIISPAYHLYVGDRQVAKYDCSDVLGDGTVSYDPEANRLILNGAHIVNSTRGISNEIDGLTITLVGENSIEVASYTAVDLLNLGDDKYSVTIEGSGSLIASGRSGIVTNNSNLTIRGGCSVNTVGSAQEAIRGFYGDVLTIDNARVRAENYGTTYRPIAGFDAVNMINCSVQTPQGAVWDADALCFKVGNTEVPDEVEIVPDCELWVGGVAVTSANATDVLGDGTVSYNASTTTLTLNNAMIQTTGYVPGIMNRIYNLKIILVGDNAIVAEKNGIETFNQLTIRGTGTLDVTGECAINAYFGEVTLQSCTIHANSTGLPAIIGAPSFSLTLNDIDLIATMEDPPRADAELTVYDGNNSNTYVPVYGYWCDGYLKCEYIMPAEQLADMKDALVSKMTFDLSTPASGSWGNAYFKVFMKEVDNTMLDDYTGYADATVVYQGPLDGTQSTMEVEFTNPYAYHGGNLLIGFYNEQKGTWKSASFLGQDNNNLGVCIHGYSSSSLDAIPVTKVTFLPKTTFAYAKATESTISGFGNVNIINAALIEPEGAVWNTTTHCFEVDGAVTSDPVVIEKYKEYALWVASTMVTNVNAHDVLGDGTVSYDASTHTLYLNGMEVNNVTANGLISQLDMLNIVLEGTNSITSSSYGIFVNAGGLTIAGTGSLNVAGSNGICITGGDLTITGECTVDATGTAPGPYSGIFGSVTSNMLVNGSANVTATADAASTYGAISGFASLTFGGECGFVSPIGVVWSNNQVKVNGVVTNGPVVIGPPVPYGLTVCLYEVTSANASDVLGDGTVSYDALTHTLTLNGVNITGFGANAIVSDLPNLNVVLVGENNISVGFNGLWGNGNVVIEGSGTLNTTGYCGIKVYGDLSIGGGCVVNAVGNDISDQNSTGIYGTGAFSITNATVTAVGVSTSAWASIAGFTDLVMNGCQITSPAGAVWSNENHRVELDGEMVTDTVAITPVSTYNLYVAGTRVTSLNAADVLGDGKVSYDASLHTLTLDGVNITGFEGYGIESQLESLRIELEGENTITAGLAGLYSSGSNVTITGLGTLNITGPYGMKVMGGRLTITSGCVVNAVGTGTGEFAGIYGNDIFLVNNATVTAIASNSTIGSIVGFSLLQLSGECDIAIPESAVWEDHCVKVGNEIVTGLVVIKPFIEYLLKLADVQVTSFNASDVLGDGKVSYDVSTNTLTLNGVCMTGIQGKGIENEIDGLNIELVGTNTIEASNIGLSSIGDALTIKGTGTLNITGSFGIYAQNCDLTIQGGCAVNVVGAGSNTNSGLHGSGCTLTIDASYVTANSVSYCSIMGFTDLIMNGCQVITPVGAWYDDSVRYMKIGNAMCYDEVVIGPTVAYDLWVAGTQVTNANASNVLGDGTVSYDASTNALTLNGLNRTGLSGIGINNQIDGLTIYLEGDNTIEATSSGLNSSGSVTIRGTGTLNATGNDGIYVPVGDLTIRGGCTVNATSVGNGDFAGIYGNLDGILTIIESRVVVTSTNNTKGTIYNFSRIEDYQCFFESPAGATWGYGNHCVEVGGVMYAGTVVIEPYVYYDIWVEGYPVANFNAADVRYDGKVSYDAATNTLNLHGVYYPSVYMEGIKNQIPGLTIVVEGDNTIVSTDHAGLMSLNADVTITGTGTLNLTGDDGIDAESSNLTITGGCTVNATGTSWGTIYSGVFGTTGYTLTVDGSTLVAESAGSSKGSLYGFSNFVMTGGCQITSPAGAVWSNVNRRVELNGEMVTAPVVIEPVVSYLLNVGPIQVTSLNASDVLGDGTVSYNASTHTLTLNNAVINEPDNGGIWSDLGSDLTIELIGNNILGPMDDGFGFYVEDNTIITGTGTLNVSGWSATVSCSGVLTIQDGCTVNVTGSNWGVDCKYLIVDNAKLDVVMNQGNYLEAAIRAEYGLETIGCNISIPLGAAWNATTECVELDGEIVKDRVFIGYATFDLKVAGIQVTTGNAADVLNDGGSVRFDAATNTLTLNDAHIYHATESGVYSEIEENLTIQLVGESTIQCPGGNGIYADEAFTVVGPGELEISAGASGISGQDDAQIRNCVVTSIGEEYGISIPGTLTIDGAVVIGDSEEYGLYVGNLTLLNCCEIVEPEGAVWNGEHNQVELGGEEYTGRVAIEPFFWFCGWDDDDWYGQWNWLSYVIPNSPYSRVVINAPASLNQDATVRNVVVTNGVTLSIGSNAILETNSLVSQTSSGVVVNPGGQLILHSAGTLAKVEKSVPASTWNNGSTGWTLLSSPIVDGAFSDHSSLVKANGQYDLYRYNETNHAGEEWVNFKQNGFANYEAGRGYLYAQGNGGTEYFEGELNYNDVTITLTYTEPTDDYPIAGFNLIGNPFPHNIYKGVGAAIDNSHLEAGYYTIASDGTLVYHSDDEPIAPMQAILVRTDATITLTIRNTTDSPTVGGQGE